MLLTIVSARRVVMKTKFKNVKDFEKLIMKMGYSKSLFSERVGVTRTYLSMVINQDRSISPELANRIMKELGKSFDDIFFIQDADNSKQNSA